MSCSVVQGVEPINEHGLLSLLMGRLVQERLVLTVEPCIYHQTPLDQALANPAQTCFINSQVLARLLGFWRVSLLPQFYLSVSVFFRGWFHQRSFRNQSCDNESLTLSYDIPDTELSFSNMLILFLPFYTSWISFEIWFDHVWLTILSLLCADSHWRWHDSDSGWCRAADLCPSHHGGDWCFHGWLCKNLQLCHQVEKLRMTFPRHTSTYR